MEKKEEERQEYVALEQALMKIEGVGEVSLYFHYSKQESENTLSNLLTQSTQSGKRSNELQGILVVAEGAEDLRIRNELSKILSSVLQLPEHRIVITKMNTKGEQ